MFFIAQYIIEARINNLISKRDAAIQHKDYDTAWVTNMKIDKNIYRLSVFSL